MQPNGRKLGRDGSWKGDIQMTLILIRKGWACKGYEGEISKLKKTLSGEQYRLMSASSVLRFFINEINLQAHTCI